MASKGRRTTRSLTGHRPDIDRTRLPSGCASRYISFVKTAQIAAVLVLAVAVPALAHHTVSVLYDPEKQATLNGVVSDVEWRQPHVIFHLKVKGSDGRLVPWTVETQAPLVVRSHGLQPDMLKPGVQVSSTVCLARDGSHRAYAQTIVVPDAGTIMSFGCYSSRSTP